MQIHHIGMLTNNLERLRDFYVTHFSARPRDLYEDLSEPVRIYFLDFPEGAKLELMSKPNLNDWSAEPMKTGFVHLAFSVGSKDAVDSFSAKLRAAGVPECMPPTLLGDGSYESCYLDPDGNQIEIVI